MDNTATAILEQALALPTGARSELVDSLIASLDEEGETDVQESWATEIKLRIAELDSGPVETVAWPEVDERLQRIVQDATNSGR